MSHKSNLPFELQIEDYDTYSPGCDSRLSVSAAISVIKMEYWMDVQHDLLVQRGIAVQGTAVAGLVRIIFSANEILALPTAPNGTIIDKTRYRKTNSSGAFDYTESNASIVGWIMDYRKKQGDISQFYNLITGSVVVYDDKLDTYQYTAPLSAIVDTVIFEVDFPSQDITELSMYSALVGTGSDNVHSRLDIYYAAAWHTIFTHDIAGGASYTYQDHDTGVYNNVTGLRIRSYGDGAMGATIMTINDVSVF